MWGICGSDKLKRLANFSDKMNLEAVPSLNASQTQQSDEVSAEPKPVVRVLLPTEPSCFPSPSKAEVHQPPFPIEPSCSQATFIAHSAKVYHLLSPIALSCFPSNFCQTVHHSELPVKPSYLLCLSWINQLPYPTLEYFLLPFEPNRLWLLMIWNIFNWLYEQIYFWLPHDLSSTLLPFCSESSNLSASRALTIIQELNSFNSFFSWAIFHLHIITVSVSPLPNEDLLSKTSPLHFDAWDYQRRNLMRRSSSSLMQTLSVSAEFMHP